MFGEKGEERRKLGRRQDFSVGITSSPGGGEGARDSELFFHFHIHPDVMPTTDHLFSSSRPRYFLLIVEACIVSYEVDMLLIIFKFALLS
jgi:hypothetical protein